jgi:uncharacterized protein (DUF983 family)
MSHRTASKAMGPAAITTIVILGATALGGAVGVALFWITTTYDVVALAHTLTVALALLLIVLVGWFEIRVGCRLLRSYRRPS